MSLRTLLVCSLSALFALSASAGGFERFPLPRTRAAEPRAVAAGPSYTWAVTWPGYQLARVGPDGVTQELFSPKLLPAVMAFDPADGGVWYASTHQVGHTTPDGESEMWWLPEAFTSGPYDIVIGPDDHIWIALSAGIARVSRTGASAFIDGTWGANDLAVGPDGNIWAAFSSRNAIGRITPAGTLTLFQQDNLNPQRIAAGADGRLWFTGSGALKAISTSGTFGETFSDSAYAHLVTGADGRLWWNRPGSSLVKWIPGAAAVESTYDLGGTNGSLHGLSAASNAVWWASTAFRIGRVTYAGDSQQWPFRPFGADASAMVTLGNAIWFTAPEANQIGKMVDGTPTLYDLPHENSRPRSITLGPDGALWFTEEGGDRVGRIDAAGTITEHTIPTVFGQPAGITSGPDGNLWITLAAADKIARLTPAGVFTEFNVPGLGSWPDSIAAGADGNLWFTQRDAAQIGRITPAGVVTEFSAGGGSPNAIVAAPDGNLWYGTNLGAYRMTASGQRTKFGSLSVFGQQRIVGPDGALWSNDPNGVIRITMDGAIHFYTNAGNGPAGYGITTGPDGKIWFSDSNTQALCRLTEDAPVTGTGATLCVASNGYVDGILASFVDPDSNPRPASQYAASVEWGDGTGSFSTQVLETSPGHFDVRGWHDYSWAESMNVVVTFTAAPGENRIGGAYTATASLVASAITTATVDFPKEGGATSVAVSGLAGCSWSAAKSDNWITFPAGNSGSGPGTLQYTVQPNTTLFSRQGTITVGERTLTIRQVAGGTGLYLVAPCRLYDSRNSGSQIGGGAEWQLSTIATCGIPFDAKALVANLVVINPAAEGWLAAYENGKPWPGVSTINYRPGRTRANNAIIPLFDAAFMLRNGGAAPVHFVIDATGYFK